MEGTSLAPGTAPRHAATYRRRLELPVSPSTLFRWHARPGAFERLVPPWERIRLVGRPARLEAGARQEMLVSIGPLRRRWLAEIVSVRPDEGFQDAQLVGPFAHWVHTHAMSAAPGGAVLEDRVEYALPLGGLGAALGGGSVARRLARTFAYRHRITRWDLERLVARGDRPPLDVLVSGASGLVGRSLCAFLSAGGHRVRRLVRRAPAREDEFRWDPAAGSLDAAALEGADAVVHLAGENIAARRWSAAQKERLVQSRVRGTRLLVEAVRAARSGPRVFVGASAVGVYGDRGDAALDEDSPPGSGFLADLCRAWEAELEPLGDVRAVALRLGVVLSPAGGALAKMLPPFRMGVGGRVGPGTQWMSWISLDDAVGALFHALERDDLSGPVNAVAPEPATNAAYTRALGRVLRRPTVFPMPAAAARLAFGELADELLLASQRVRPARLAASGYRWLLPDLDDALRHQLGRIGESRTGSGD